MYVINDLLSSNTLNEKDKQQFLEKNQEQLERIEWLVTALLKLSKLESGTIQLKKETITVQELLKKAIQPLEIPLELKNQTLHIEGNKKIKLSCDINWTKEALLNILKNAHEHTDKEGAITIHYEENPLYILITIHDNGEGIEKKDLPHVFERFYKGSHNSKESIGIGLNMSKNIIERQNGSIHVESKKGEYTQFTIKFYKS